VLRRLILCFVVAALVAPAAAVAHVTIQPGEWEPGAFAAMVFRVPNERDNAETTSVTVQFPENVPSARFQTHPSCEREVQREPLAEPIEDLTERIVSVTWTCQPAIPADGFDEFGVSFQIPEDAAEGDEILFPATQTYSSGEVVEWIDPDPEGESPAPRVTVIAAEEEEAAAPAETTTEEAAPVQASSSDDDDDTMSTVAIIFGIAGLVAGLIALGVALFRKPKAATP
jgi:periplasmic copper chaperone A